MMPARCSGTQLERIRAVEEELNAVVVAYARPPVLAALSDEQLDRLRRLEEELGVTLVIYESGSSQ